MRFRSKRPLSVFAGTALIGLGLASTAAYSEFRPTPKVPSECGFVDDMVPDFTLNDVNTNSDTYGQEVGLSDVLGQVLVIYWANAN